jgi:hypothetical protein
MFPQIAFKKNHLSNTGKLYLDSYDFISEYVEAVVKLDRRKNQAKSIVHLINTSAGVSPVQGTTFWKGSTEMNLSCAQGPVAPADIISVDHKRFDDVCVSGARIGIDRQLVFHKYLVRRQ